MNNLNFKLLKSGQQALINNCDQIKDGMKWRDILLDFTVRKDQFKVRRPDKKSKEIILQLKEIWHDLDNIKDKIQSIIYE